MNPIVKDLAKGPLHMVKSFNGYYVNGFNFHTEGYGANKSIMNSGVCIKGSSNTASELEYYGRITEIIQLEYPALPIKRTVLFKCSWFDPTPKYGTRVHPQYKIVDVNSRRFFNRYEPFILAVQAAQVYYATYPSLKRTGHEWLAVYRVKARAIVEVPAPKQATVVEAFQEDDVHMNEIDIQVEDGYSPLIHPDCSYIDIDDPNTEIEAEDNAEDEEELDDDDDDGDDDDDDDDDEDDED